jgi:hypothetical protein
MDKGFTSTPNMLDDLGLDPYQHRVLVFIIRWKGKATVETPFIPISLKYISEKTGISVSKVKECIHDLEHEFHLIAVHRRKRLRNLYDIRPLFTALLKMQAGPKKEQPAQPAPNPAVRDELHADDPAPDDLGGATAPDPDVDDSGLDPEPHGEDDGAENGEAEARRSQFGTPSHAPDDRVYPGMDEDGPSYEDWLEEEEVREACQRGEHIPGKTALVIFGGRQEVIPIDQVQAVARLGGSVLRW